MTSSSSRFGGLRLRVVTAVIGAILLITGTVYGQWTYFCVFLVISILTQWEFYRLSNIDAKLPLKVWGTFIGQLFFSNQGTQEGDLTKKFFMSLFETG